MSSPKDCWVSRNFDLVAVAVILLFVGMGLMGREVRQQLPFRISPAVQPMPAEVYEIRDQARDHVRWFGEELRRQAAEMRASLRQDCERLRADSRESRRGIENLREEARRMRDEVRRRLRDRNSIRWE
jgi:DNA anti-recombination protein RmuC